jgi:hypothetical protein
MMLASSGAAAQQPLAGLPSFEGKQIIPADSVNIESTMLASTAVDAAAAEIVKELGTASGKVIVLAGTESVDFSQVAMIEQEMAAIREQLEIALDTPMNVGNTPDDRFISQSSTGSIIPWITGLAGVLRSNTELTGVDVTIAPRVLAAAVAAKLPNRAVLPSESVGARIDGALMTEFRGLQGVAKEARKQHDALAGGSGNPLKVARLEAALQRYDEFFERVTKADKGAVPIVAAARLSNMLEGGALLLRVNTDKAGGTVVKRTNILTFFGADGVRISGGLVASYQLTDPNSGSVKGAGMVTCRTALTTLKRVQDTTWKPSPRQSSELNSQSGQIRPPEPVAICRTIKSIA